MDASRSRDDSLSHSSVKLSRSPSLLPTMMDGGFGVKLPSLADKNSLSSNEQLDSLSDDSIWKK